MEKKVLNLTMHPASPEQKEEGVVEPANKAEVKALLNFEDLPPREEVAKRADALVALCVEGGFEAAMVGGAPFLMHALHERLVAAGVEPQYAFSKRESVEHVNEEGEVVKRSVFKHLGFVEAP